MPKISVIVPVYKVEKYIHKLFSYTHLDVYKRQALRLVAI